MWRLKFPLFAIQLSGTALYTLLELAAFQLSTKKDLWVNLFLTLLVIILGWLWWWMPVPADPVQPELTINIRLTPEITPIPLAVETDQLQVVLEKYEQAIGQKSFISQAEYVNLAVVAHAAGQYETATKFLTLARYIDPNREFFVY